MSEKPQDSLSRKLEFTPESTTALIHIIRDKEIQHQLLDKNAKRGYKGHVWVTIADRLKEKGYDFGEEGPKICNQKWRNLKKAYMTHTTGGTTTPYIKDLELTFSMSKELLDQTNQSQTSDDEKDYDSLNQLVPLSDVVNILKQFDKEKQKKDKDKSDREDQKLDMLEAVLTEQNRNLRKLITWVKELTRALQEKRKLEEEEEQQQQEETRRKRQKKAGDKEKKEEGGKDEEEGAEQKEEEVKGKDGQGIEEEEKQKEGDEGKNIQHEEEDEEITVDDAI